MSSGVVIAAAFFTTTVALAQAWVPPAGTGAISVVYQTIENTGHRLTDGSLLEGYDSLSRGILFELDYAFTDRFSVSAGVPYIFAKYLGPEPSFSGLPLDECRCWNHGWQDFGATARYNVVSGPFAVTPFVSIGIPTHDYNYFGEAVLGRNLTELRVGLAAGQRLDMISPRFSVQQRYTYAFVERVLGLPNNRSNFSIEPAFLIGRKLFTRAILAWQRTHGGLRGTDFETAEQFEQFDRLVRDNNFQAGA
ncbi:MAG TPA: hypothetical protein VNA04_04175, partial [Thermoanaerobaculia bacterium]|nr:hypothetical protein [Thermoanaerobaculia bacterium]